MTDDHRVPVGAAAPTRVRLVRSLLARDVIWVIVASVLLIGTALFSLRELRGESTSTSDPGMRIYAVVVPVIAIGIAAVAAKRKSDVLAAAAIGVLAPSIALVGLISVGYFLDKSAAYADLGVAVGMVASVIGVAAIARWFVYHPVAMSSDEERPIAPLAWALVGVSLVAAVAATVASFGDEVDVPARYIGRGDDGLQIGGQLFFALIVMSVAVVGAAVRTRLSFVVAAAGGFTQTLAVLGALLDDAEIELGSIGAVWTSAVGLTALVVLGVVAVVGTQRMRLDEPGDLDHESWRWTSTE